MRVRRFWYKYRLMHSAMNEEKSLLQWIMKEHEILSPQTKEHTKVLFSLCSICCISVDILLTATSMLVKWSSYFWVKLGDETLPWRAEIDLQQDVQHCVVLATGLLGIFAYLCTVRYAILQTCAWFECSVLQENSTQSSCSFERGDETIRRHLNSDKILNLRHATQTLRASMKTTMISPIPTLSVSSTLSLSTTDVPACSLGGSSRSLIYDTSLTHESWEWKMRNVTGMKYVRSSREHYMYQNILLHIG